MIDFMGFGMKKILFLARLAAEYCNQIIEAAFIEEDSFKAHFIVMQVIISHSIVLAYVLHLIDM